MKSDRQKLKERAWKLFSQYIRMKYSDDNGDCQCFTCGTVKPWKEMQAGHGISGRGNYVLFLEEVVRPQCYGCNVGRNGNYEIFVPKLIELYTAEQYNKWVSESRKPKKITMGDFRDFIDDINRRLIPLIDGRSQ